MVDHDVRRCVPRITGPHFTLRTVWAWIRTDVVQYRMQGASPVYLRSDKPGRSSNLWDSAPLLRGCDILCSIVQPLPSNAGPDPSAGGTHWICLIFLNIGTIDWTAEPDSLGPDVSVLVFDSLAPSEGMNHCSLSDVKKAFQEYLAHEAAAVHEMDIEDTRLLAGAVPWRLVRSPRHASVNPVCWPHAIHSTSGSIGEVVYVCAGAYPPTTGATS